ncbi:sugar transferase [Campylobacter cuniculorum]|uniref:sugar transferase n=1 Tax=Campylobacter cuniculorum TaxID=374106 RepID=UPI0023F48613|nr:sugar transferase [Campylobacter cuniculorum]
MVCTLCQKENQMQNLWVHENVFASSGKLSEKPYLNTDELWGGGIARVMQKSL